MSYDHIGISKRFTFLTALLGALVAFLCPAAARADFNPEWEVGGFLGGHFFSGDSGLGRDKLHVADNQHQHSAIFGFRLGVGLHPRLMLEAEFGIVPTSTVGGMLYPSVSVTALAWRAHVLFHVLTGRFRPFVLLGGGAETSTSANTLVVRQDTDGGFHFGVGAKYDIRPSWGVRLDGRLILLPGPNQDPLVTEDYEVLFSLYGRWGGTPRPPAPVPIGEHVSADLDRTRDSDGDGVPDYLDKCPAQAGARELDGCPDPDSDGDGIPDRLDRCPQQPETKNGYEDSDGCPDEVPQAVARFTGAIEGISFQSGESVLLPSSFKVLDRAVQVLRDNPTVQLEIQGHTDNRGPAEINTALSRERAEAVRKYLVDKGIAADRLRAAGYGPDRPIADNGTAAGRARNRRVEFQLIK